MSSPPLPYNRKNALASTIASDNAPSIAGKIVLTTGVTQGGLGATFVSEIAQHAPKLLILAGRSPAKLQATAAKISALGVETRILKLDLASQAQVREAANEVLGYAEPCIDVLVNSAGTMGGPYQTTPEGLELQFGANHIGHFLFTNLIMSKLLASKAAGGPRIVNVSSDGHRFSGIRFEDPGFSGGKAYDQWEAYGQSKTANILFSKALAEKLGARGLRAYSLHPGVALGTSLAPHGFGDEDFASLVAKDKEIGWDRELDFKSLDECAATHVAAAFDPRLDRVNGVYLENGNLSDDVQETAKNPDDVEKLWKLSEELVGQPFSY
ncbi:hypothetical protein N0V83_008515 [Neocucurbitaria cava]|uniref:NAD(P)-binding protein n=1 Tax=Neocucurbitaria cava TaxID=798079 RepID=A0A9W8Y371_9PLEO|nr:hypothetical protein N0V83_008515 [Neocucurbitaria cava]